MKIMVPGELRSHASPVGAWYALYTRHQHEKIVAQTLLGKGFEIFLPLQTVPRRWKDRTKMLSLPLFPCYVFLRGGLERWAQIITTPGVFSLVGFGDRPTAIPEAEIEALRRVEACCVLEPHPFLRCGDLVRVISGPLEGIQGILVRKKNQFRLVLSVELLEKSAAVEVDVATVERMAKPEVRHHRSPQTNLLAQVPAVVLSRSLELRGRM
jgi:transcription antitermination factor NusG